MPVGTLKLTILYPNYIAKTIDLYHDEKCPMKHYNLALYSYHDKWIQ